MDRSRSFATNKKIKKKQFIVVNSLVDLNQMPSISEPITVTNSKHFGILCCRSGPLIATVNIPRVGYVAGEGIPISANIENGSTKTMSNTRARLVQHVVLYSSNGNTKKCKKTIHVKLYIRA